MLHKDAFIDLPNISLPFSYKDVFTDQDYEIIETKTTPEKGITTKNIVWGSVSQKQKDYSDVSIMGFIIDKNIMYVMKDHFEKTYNSSILDNNVTVATGKKILPVTLITFSDNTPWHREGFCPDWSTKRFEEEYHNFSPRRRYNYAVNYPLYVKDAEGTKVEFAKTSQDIKSIEQRLMLKMIENNSYHEEEQGIRVSRSLDQIMQEDIWKDDIDIIDTKHGYDCPYIINLSSYHKVSTTNATRVSLRYMASTKYQWQDIENLYNAGELFTNA